MQRHLARPGLGWQKHGKINWTLAESAAKLANKAEIVNQGDDDQDVGEVEGVEGEAEDLPDKVVQVSQR